MEVIVAYAPLINTLATAAIAYFVFRAQTQARIASERAAAERAKLAEAVTTLEKNTNSIKDELVKTAEAKALAEGKLLGVKEVISSVLVKPKGA